MRKINKIEFAYEVVRNLKYHPSKTTVEQDVAWLKNQAEAVFTFHRAQETPAQLEWRQNLHKKRLTKPMYLGIGLLIMTVGTMLFAFTISSIPGLNELVGTTPGKLLLLIPVLISLYPVFKGLKESCIEERRKYIDNSNYQEYEIRKMYDGQLVLIPFQNFDQNNPLAKEVLLPEHKERPFDHIYFLQNRMVSETDEHVIIECDMRIKYINRLTLNHWLYLESDRVSRFHQIYMQKSSCPEGLLAFLGCTKGDTAGNVSIEAANAEPEESGVFTKGGNAACCRSYKYTKKAIPVKTITMLSLGLMMAALLIAMIALFVFEQPMELAMMISCTAFVLMMVMVIVSRQGGVSLQLIQYLRDEVGDYYMVQFTKGMSTKAVGVKQQYLEQDMQKAQDTGAACFYVNRYKAGYKDYDPVIGGEAKVICLKELKLIRKGLLKSKYSYRQNGRKRKIKIKNCYDGLVEELSRYQ